MKNILKKTVIIVLMAVMGFTMIACGGGGGSDPKSLAKQAAEIFQQWEDEKISEDEAEKKLEAIAKKLEKLSDENRSIYEKEFDRLTDDW